MEEKNKMPLWKLILVTVILLAFPLLVGGIFSYINGNTTFKNSNKLAPNISFSNLLNIKIVI